MGRFEALDETQAPPIEPTDIPDGLARATFAAGCFWGVEELFRHVPGVVDVISGYTAGHAAHPTYRQVGSGTTGHAEAGLVPSDPAQVSYDQLLGGFWRHHDPTTPNRQGPDVGTQYRSGIYTHGDEQLAQAQASLQRSAGRFARPIVTEVRPAATFWPAEAYHQRYTERTGRGGCHVANW